MYQELSITILFISLFISILVTYWIIRLAVCHGIRDSKGDGIERTIATGQTDQAVKIKVESLEQHGWVKVGSMYDNKGIVSQDMKRK